MSRHRWLAGTAMLWSLVLAPPPAAARPLAHGPTPATKAAPTPAHPIVLAMLLDLKQGELGRWTEISSVRRPSRIVELCVSFQRDYPHSTHRDEARALEAGASRAVTIKREVGLSGEFFETTRGDAAFDARLLGAARGDAEAAYGVAIAFGDGRSSVSASLYRHEQWLRFAAELGHARASWDLAQIYNAYGRVADAAHFEKRATELGYKPPPRLSNRDY
ncbi:MAG: hypothetical protein IPH39_00720 [Sulfuritalea sp.]|jgi:hypothetical protein|nr:hypothetical protein [Sulfuritalea sp.]